MNQLEKTIRLVHSKSGLYKTILHTSANFYLVVTRVNYMTANLWLNHYNSIQLDKTKRISKVNWLVMLKSYRRDKLNELINQPNPK